MPVCDRPNVAHTPMFSFLHHTRAIGSNRPWSYLRKGYAQALVSDVCKGPQPGAVVLPNCAAEVAYEQQLCPKLMQVLSHIFAFRNAAAVKLMISKHGNMANPH